MEDNNQEILQERPTADAEEPVTPAPEEATEDEEEEGGESVGASLMSHVIALRKAIIVSAAAVLIMFVAVFYVAIDRLMAWIIAPIEARGITVIYTAMSEALVTKFKVALIAAFVIAAPIVFWQLWSFIKPALYPHEKRAFRILFFVSVFLFLLGVTFCYMAVYMLAVDFFLVAGENLATPMLSIDKYVAFLFGFVVPFGIAFLLPVALYITTRLGLTNAKQLSSLRRYIILGIAVMAAILTPPDVVSQLMLGIPMWVLFEISVLVARFVKPRERE